MCCAGMWKGYPVLHADEEICVSNEALQREVTTLKVAGPTQTGVVGRGSLFAVSHWMRNGSASRRACWDGRHNGARD